MPKIYTAKRTLLLFCLMAFTGLAHAQFTLYQRMFYTGIPYNLTPYLTRYVLDYNAATEGSNGNACTPNPANLQQYAAIGLASPGQPVSFDVELNQGWPAYNTAAFTDTLNNYIQIVNDFKAYNTTSKVGFYAVPPQQIYNTFSNVNSSFAPTAQAMTPLANAVDYYSPDFYNYGSIDTAAWRKAADTTLAVIREYYGTSKPVYPYISPIIGSAMIDSVAWLYNLNYLYTHTQGALLWSGYTPNWDPNAPWWRCTKMFLVDKGLVPPFVLDNFTITPSTSGNMSLQWTTSSDTVSTYFVVQRSTDSIHFTSVSGQISKNGYSFSQNQYAFTDSAARPSTGNSVYYRLAITDAYNNVTYSAVYKFTKSMFRSAGGGVNADLDSTTNWQAFNGTTWTPATVSPANSFAQEDTIIIRAGDTWQDPESSLYITTGVTLIDSGSVGTIGGGLTNHEILVLAGTTPVTLPGSASLAGGSWGNLVIDDTAGVTITQSSGDNLVHVDSLALQTGLLTVTAGGGHAVALYLDGPVSVGSGSITVGGAGGIIADGTVPQVLPSGIFQNNTVPALTLSNTQGVTCGGPLTVTGTTHLTTQTAFSVSGNYTPDSLTVDTLGSYTPLTVSGIASLAGVLTIKHFATGPVAGQQYVILSADSLTGSLAATPVLPSGYAGTVANVGHTVVLTVGAPYAFTDSLLTTADAFVKSGTGNATTNYGTASYLGVVSGYYQTYLKFNISSITAPVSNAQLRLYNENAVSTTWQLYKVNAAGNNWTETGITWNNQPAADTLLATLNSPSGSGYVYWDITAKLDSLLPTAGGTISFRVVSTTSVYDAFSSKENPVPQEAPYLMLNKTAPANDSIQATADAFVKSSTPTTNYGYNSYLAADNNFYNTYLKFDLQGNKGRVLDAMLRLYSLAGASTQWQLYKVNNDTWTESGLTWNNQPGGDTLLATITAPASAGFVYWDIAQELQHIGTDSTLSLEVVATAGVYSAFGSRQGTSSQAPRIVYTTDTSGAGTLAVVPLREWITAVTEDKPDTAAAGSLKIYPNPASGSCFITSPRLINTIALYDNRGRLVRAVGSLQVYQYTLNLEGLSSGLYYLRINKEPVGTAGKVVKVE